MFSYTDSVYQTNSGCHTKNVESSYSSQDAYHPEYPPQPMNMQQWHEPTFPSDMLQQDTLDQMPYGQYYSSPHNTTTNNTTNHCPSLHGPMIPSSNAPSVYASNTTQSLTQNQRPRITTSLWDDEGTVCYQVDVRGIWVARRQDNDMINGTKLLNVTGMSRGKRDGILKNEKGRVVVKVGAMHLKGVWVTFARAKALAVQFNIVDHLHPLFVDDPALYFYSNQHNYLIPNHPVYLQSAKPTGQYNARPSSLYNAELVNYTPELPAPCVPSMIPLYGYSHLHPH